MSTETLSDFISLLEKNNELQRVAARQSGAGDFGDRRPGQQISRSAWPRRTRPHGAGKLGGRALLFENVQGSDIPVAINTFGSYWRVNQALGTTNLEALADRVQQLVKPEMPTTLLEKMKKLPDLLKLGSFPPKSVRTGICQQVVHEGVTPI